MPGFLDSFTNAIERLNPLRDYRFERDFLPDFGAAFVPPAQGQQSVYQRATKDPFLTRIRSSTKKSYPILSNLGTSIATGISAGVTTLNPMVGLLVGGATFLANTPDMVMQKLENNQLEKQQKVAEEKAKKLDKLYNDVGIIAKYLKEQHSPNRVQHVNNGISTENVVNRYNNLKIERTASFSIPGQTAAIHDDRYSYTRFGTQDLFKRRGQGNAITRPMNLNYGFA